MLKKKFYIVIFILLIGLNTFFDILEPKFAKTLIDTSLNTSYTNDILMLGGLWMLIFICKYINRYIFQILSLKFKISVFSDIQNYLFNHTLKLPISFYQKNSPSYLVSRQFDDTFGIDGLMIYNIIEGLFSMIQFLIILGIMFKYNILLALLSMILISLDIVINFSFPLKKLYKNHNEDLAVAKKELTNSFQGIKLIKISNKIDYEINRNYKFLKKYYFSLRKRDNTNIIRNLISRLLKDLSIPIIVIVGVLLIYKNSITVGTVTLFLIYFNKLSQAFVPAINLVPLFKISKASAERLYNLSTIDPEESPFSFKDRHKLNHIDLIEFKNLSFSYDENNQVLNDINFKIKSNQFIAFVGQSGSGKTSIIKLLLKLFNPSKGSIYINGIDINSIDTQTLRKLISYVDQEGFLFNRSLYENLTYNYESLNSENLINDYINEFSLDPLISNLSDGLNSKISEDSSNLSGGEKQRICIIRELLKKSSVLILDEYTSSLDTITENKIQSKLMNLAKNKMIIMIAHKLSTIKNADKIFVLDDGNIVESGTHDELMMIQGKYYNLYLNQKN